MNLSVATILAGAGIAVVVILLVALLWRPRPELEQAAAAPAFDDEDPDFEVLLEMRGHLADISRDVRTIRNIIVTFVLFGLLGAVVSALAIARDDDPATRFAPIDGFCDRTADIDVDC